MSGFIDNTSNIDAAEIAAEYRAPDQGVSAKSNYNITWNEYRKMTPRANQSANVLTTASSQTLQAQDFGGSAGFVPGARTYTTGSSKGATTYSHSGVATSVADQYVSADSSSANVGNFGLGSTGGTSGLDLSNVASFPSGTTFVGLLNRAVSLGGYTYFMTTGANAATNWTTMYIRTLYPGGSITVGGTTLYNITTTVERSTFSYTTDGSLQIWSRNYGLGTNYAALLMAYPTSIEFA